MTQLTGSHSRRILSNSVSKEHQGIAASLVVTVVNYSISLALGLAGTVEAEVDASGNSSIPGYRAAQYFSVGLGGLGIFLAVAFSLRSRAAIQQRGKDPTNNSSEKLFRHQVRG